MKHLVKLLYITAFILALTPGFAYSDDAVENLYETMRQKMNNLPMQVNHGLVLSDIELATVSKRITRRYVHPMLDFGRLPAASAKSFSRMITSELLEQCHVHRVFIEDSGLTFEYQFRDKNDRMMLLVEIDSERCTRFNRFH